ncbi:hypothetical protein DNTS_017017 [Danionella cerebrum]|uniref:C-type lectin domain-containing protein n=1 Tax=Danionella cerebrum TaxID=2873325 RepID=A0A553MKL3_9TELE|nr:hypothetical protein DNTS_017017 [Danionella translucida]
MNALQFLLCVVCVVQCSEEQSDSKGKSGKRADGLKKSFHRANDDCIAKGGTLSTPVSPEENQQLYRYVQDSIDPDARVWLGVNDIMKEGEWSDQMGTEIRFKNWESEVTHQPDGGRRENCVILSSSANGKWFDEDCRGERASVCQFNIV